MPKTIYLISLQSPTTQIPQVFAVLADDVARFLADHVTGEFQAAVRLVDVASQS